MLSLSQVLSMRNSASATYLTLNCVFCVGMSVFVLIFIILHTKHLPNSILTPQVASC